MVQTTGRENIVPDALPGICQSKWSGKLFWKGRGSTARHHVPEREVLLEIVGVTSPFHLREKTPQTYLGISRRPTEEKFENRPLSRPIQSARDFKGLQRYPFLTFELFQIACVSACLQSLSLRNAQDGSNLAIGAYLDRSSRQRNCGPAWKPERPRKAEGFNQLKRRPTSAFCRGP